MKDVVYGIEIGGKGKAYPVEVVGREGLVNDEVGGTELVLVGNPGTKAVVAYERAGARFVSLLGEEGRTTLVDENGVEWLVGDASLEALDGSGDELARLRAGPASGSGGGRSSRRRSCMWVRGRGECALSTF